MEISQMLKDIENQGFVSEINASEFVALNCLY